MSVGGGPRLLSAFSKGTYCVPVKGIAVSKAPVALPACVLTGGGARAIHSSMLAPYTATPNSSPTCTSRL